MRIWKLLHPPMVNIGRRTLVNPRRRLTSSWALLAREPDRRVCRIRQVRVLDAASRCHQTQIVASSDSPKRQDHDDTAVDPGIARQPDTAVTRRIYFKDFLAPGCREPFSLRQGRLDDLTTSRLGDGAHPNPKSPAKGSAKHPRDFCGTLPSPSVLSCARRSQRPSSPQVLDQFVANGIRQLQNRLSTETRNCPAGSPLQGECRRFDPVSTHQDLGSHSSNALEVREEVLRE